MAATIARATGYDKSGRVKETHRLGSHSANVVAATFHTFASATVFADGSGEISVRQNGRDRIIFTFGPEDAAPRVTGRAE